jgi:hypothetical protein
LSFRRDRRRRLCLIGLGLVIVAFLIAAGTLIPFRELNRLVELRAQGAVAPAHVTKFETDITGRRATDVIQFEFQPARGTPRTGVLRIIHGRTQPLDLPEMNRQMYEGRLLVRYLPDDPDVFALDAWLPQKIDTARFEALGYLALAGVIGLTGLGLTAWGLPAWRSRRRHRQ